MPLSIVLQECNTNYGGGKNDYLITVKVLDDNVFAIIKSHCFLNCKCFNMVSFRRSKKKSLGHAQIGPLASPPNSYASPTPPMSSRLIANYLSSPSCTIRWI